MRCEAELRAAREIGGLNGAETRRGVPRRLNDTNRDPRATIEKDGELALGQRRSGAESARSTRLDAPPRILL